MRQQGWALGTAGLYRKTFTSGLVGPNCCVLALVKAHVVGQLLGRNGEGQEHEGKHTMG
jgi:hypothetical protein